jgi:hypothetical protein
MTGGKWFHAQIRWAVMEESKRGLVQWKEAAYIFQSENHETAFKKALEEGRRHEECSKPGRHRIAVKLAQIVSLDWLGLNPMDILISAGYEKPTERLPFDHVFDPEGGFPPPSF